MQLLMPVPIRHELCIFIVDGNVECRITHIV